MLSPGEKGGAQSVAAAGYGAGEDLATEQCGAAADAVQAVAAGAQLGGQAPRQPGRW